MRSVFLDRDGTINREVHHLRRVEELVLLDGAAEGIRLLNHAGLRVIVVTNQAAVARYPSLEAFLEAARIATRGLSARHALPNEKLELFDGGDRSVDSFFRMFPNLKLTPRSVRSNPPD